MREDLELRQEAKKRGWTERKHVRDEGIEPPNFPLRFDKGDKRVWFCSKRWAVAELTLTEYVNRRYYLLLQHALDIES